MQLNAIRLWYIYDLFRNMSKMMMMMIMTIEQRMEVKKMIIICLLVKRIVFLSADKPCHPIQEEV